MTNMLRLALFLICLSVLTLTACQGKKTDIASAKPVVSTGVSASDIIAAPAGDWLSHGRTYAEERFSPLTQVSVENVDELGLAWSFDLETSKGIEATPIVHNGVLYVTGAWNVVYAINAVTGEQIWAFDPEVDRERGSYTCCGIINRGVAIWGEKVFVGTIDGRLIAIDINSGQSVWDVNTINKSRPYTITGAPRVVKGNVIIGNGGADLGVRGYVSAYDVDSGKMNWRFYTVPGNPEDGFENDAMADAAKTWAGDWWTQGGGGTVWDSMAYDPDLDLLYIGVGNGSPWNHEVRSNGEGDNLFLSSIVALRPDTGEYVWHYQTTPGETWDYTATQHMILAEMDIEGQLRDVIMQAPKNGFFYVLDRKTGELLSAKNFVPINWATHVDIETGRPVEIAEARWPNQTVPRIQLPGPLGGHNWHPMSYSPDSGLVYIPAHELPHVYLNDPNFIYDSSSWNTGTDMIGGNIPTDKAIARATRAALKGMLIAWDPVKQEAAWTIKHNGPWNGGVLSTAGNLVFQGTADAHLSAVNAESGEKAWSFFTQTGIVAAPISFEVNGDQYVSVATGWGGVYALTAGGFDPVADTNAGRVLTFKIGGTSQLPEIATTAIVRPEPPVQFANAETIQKGERLYANRCLACHGVHAITMPGLNPSLRYSPSLSDAETWNGIILEGWLAGGGMPNFGKALSEEDAEALRAYVIAQARSGLDEEFYKSLRSETQK